MSRKLRNVRIALAALSMPMLVTAGVPAAQAQSRPASISASDRAQGAEAHPQILQQFGGAYNGRQAAYVSQVGRRIAAQSGIADSQSAYTATLLNSNVMNAFAIPGGYVYVTRQLLATMNDEAELAFVMGHEVGHVAARHAQKRSSRSTLGSIGSLLLGAVTGSSQVANLAGQASQYLVLGYSRSQEYEADSLGVRYLGQASYDPLAAPDMLAALAGETNLDARIKGQPAEGSKPSWASTHPLTSDRITRARSIARQTVSAQKLRNRDAFLNAIDGMLVDDDPAQGIVDGQSFRHPGLRLGFDAPAGYEITNATDAVTITGNGGQAKFSGGAMNGSLEAYVDGVFRALGGQTQIQYSRPERTSVNGFQGLTSGARANTKSGAVDVTVTAFQSGNNQAYHFVTITPAGSGVGPFRPLIGSFHRLSDAEAGNIRPRRLQVVTVNRGDTVQKLSARMAYPDYRQERFLALNALEANRMLVPGSRVKLVVYGPKQ
jgi:predicted Zn-dependent protease